MRRRMLVVVGLGLAATLVLAGCGAPAGVDGNLINDWPALSNPKPAVPPAPACYLLQGESEIFTNYLPTPVDCARSHNMETYHVGTFTGADASAKAPPTETGPAIGRAFAACQTAARSYLGADWRAGALRLDIRVPNETQWGGGARWYRCDLYEIRDYSTTTRSGSLRGALSGSGPVVLGCLRATKKDGRIAFGASVGCDKLHEAEFAGVYRAPEGPYPSEAKRRTLREKGCLGVVAKFAGLPNDGRADYRTGWIFDDFEKLDWARGDRSIRCYIMPPKPVRRSLKNAGPGVLPIR